MRVQFIELHEQSWFPPTIRTDITDAMQFGLRLLGIYSPVIPLLQNVVQATGSRCIVDLCSGGGGPWLDLQPQLQGGPDILLTDRYPEEDRLISKGTGQTAPVSITFCADPVDAMNIPKNLKGLRTMFSAFHHFRPAHAEMILQNAVDAGVGICIFEASKRDFFAILSIIPWAMTPFLFTPWLRPFRWSRLLWTYLVPVIPIVLLFDGIVSCLRTYSQEELRGMVNKLRSEGYEWEIQECGTRRFFPSIICLTGHRSSTRHLAWH